MAFQISSDENTPPTTIGSRTRTNGNTALRPLNQTNTIRANQNNNIQTSRPQSSECSFHWCKRKQGLGLSTCGKCHMPECEATVKSDYCSSHIKVATLLRRLELTTREQSQLSRGEKAKRSDLVGKVLHSDQQAFSWKELVKFDAKFFQERQRADDTLELACTHCPEQEAVLKTIFSEARMSQRSATRPRRRKMSRMTPRSLQSARDLKTPAQQQSRLRKPTPSSASRSDGAQVGVACRSEPTTRTAPSQYQAEKATPTADSQNSSSSLSSSSSSSFSHHQYTPSNMQPSNNVPSSSSTNMHSSNSTNMHPTSTTSMHAAPTQHYPSHHPAPSHHPTAAPAMHSFAPNGYGFAPQPSWYKPLIVNHRMYLSLGKIGKGGSAKVYKVIDPSDCQIYAVKVVSLVGATASSRRSFENEVELLNMLKTSTSSQKRCVVGLHDQEKTQDTMKLVLEFGETDLSTFLRSLRDDLNTKRVALTKQYRENRQRLRKSASSMSQQTLSEAESNCKQALVADLGVTYGHYWTSVRYVFQQMLEAVHMIHKHHIVHGDLKPANFVMSKGRLKLIDFGIAGKIDIEQTMNLHKDNAAGTLNYISPEALVNRSRDSNKVDVAVGVKADVWSLGIILYRITYSMTPFEQINPKAKRMEAITNRKITIKCKEDRDFPFKYPKVVIDLIKRCLVRDIDQRASTQELLRHPFVTNI